MGHLSVVCAAAALKSVDSTISRVDEGEEEPAKGAGESVLIQCERKCLAPFWG